MKKRSYIISAFLCLVMLAYQNCYEWDKAIHFSSISSGEDEDIVPIKFELNVYNDDEEVLFPPILDVENNNRDENNEDVILECQELIASEFEPQLYYHWKKPSTFSEYDQIISSPTVGDINGDGIPEIAFTSSGAVGYNSYSVLRVLNGVNLKELFSIGSTELAPHGKMAPLLIDIDRDGLGEVVYVHYRQPKIIALNSDGSLRWEITTRWNTAHGGLSATDIDGDGTAEIISNGEILFETQTGPDSFTVNKVRYTLGEEYHMMNLSQFAMKLSESDPTVAIIDSFGVYELKNDEYQMRFPSECERCFASAADINSEFPGKEVIYTGTGIFKMYSSTGHLISEGSLIEESGDSCPKSQASEAGGAPTIGDFDGNPETSEFAIVTGMYLKVFDQNGNLIAHSKVADCSSRKTGVTSFDFNGDGQPEILFADENTFRVYHMENGALEVLWETPNSSGTLYEYPVVVDLNGDTSPEILIVANTYLGGTDKGLRIFSASTTRIEDPRELHWMPTRNIWNQHNYFVSNVDDSLGATMSNFLNSEVDKNFRRNIHGTSAFCR